MIIVAAAATAAIPVTIVVLSVWILHSFFPPMVVFAGLGALIAGFTLRGWKWGPLACGIYGLIALGLLGPFAAMDLRTPAAPSFPISLAQLLIAPTGLIAGFTAHRRLRQGAPATTPRWLSGLLVSLAGLFLGAVAVGQVPTDGSAVGISPAVADKVPLVTMHNFTFAQDEIRVKAGETVVLRLENHDNAAHTFDLDKFDVHVNVLPGKTALAVFRPTQVGTYTIYCAPHYHKETGQGMKARLVVTE